jgi:probable F420-dependent oxidoreductase
MRFGLRLLHLHGDVERTTAVVEEADRLGFESAWLPEHLVVPADPEASPDTGHPEGIPSGWPWFDPFVYLAHLGARTDAIRLGTNVYVMALRNPFVAARSIQTLDLVSNGRVEVGVGAGWLRPEWEAVGVDMAGRGRRLEEAITVCRKLWCNDPVDHQGEHFAFSGLRFLPKPIQRGGPPIHVGGETPVALARAARLGDGWIGRDHDLSTAAPLVAELRRLVAEEGRDPSDVEVTVRATAPSLGDLAAWEQAGVHRLLVSPWPGEGRDVTDLDALIEGLRAFVARHGAGEPPRAPRAGSNP